MALLAAFLGKTTIMPAYRGESTIHIQPPRQLPSPDYTMSLLGNHLEQIALSSSAIADLPYEFLPIIIMSHSQVNANLDLQVSPAPDLHKLVAEFARYHRSYP